MAQITSNRLKKSIDRTKFGKQKRKRLLEGIFKGTFCNLILIIFSLLVLFPFFYMVCSSFRTYASYTENVNDFWPSPFTWDNYRICLKELPILRGYANTLTIVICELPINLFFVGMEAFSFSKLRLRNKTFWLLFLLSAMMIPGAVLLTPRYIIYSKIGWLDTLLPLIIPNLVSNSGRMFFLIQYMMGIPSELVEAAKVDGASYIKTYVTIMLPLALPALAAQGIFGFMAIWNDYFAPSIYLTTQTKMTLQALLARFTAEFKSSGKYPVVFAGSVLSCIPMIVVYLILQKYFIKSMSIGAVKG